MRAKFIYLSESTIRLPLVPFACIVDSKITSGITVVCGPIENRLNILIVAQILFLLKYEVVDGRVNKILPIIFS